MKFIFIITLILIIFPSFSFSFDYHNGDVNVLFDVPENAYIYEPGNGEIDKTKFAIKVNIYNSSDSYANVPIKKLKQNYESKRYISSSGLPVFYVGFFDNQNLVMLKEFSMGVDVDDNQIGYRLSFIHGNKLIELIISFFFNTVHSQLEDVFEMIDIYSAKVLPNGYIESDQDSQLVFSEIENEIMNNIGNSNNLPSKFVELFFVTETILNSISVK
jgi:hypothetical protein